MPQLAPGRAALLRLDAGRVLTATGSGRVFWQTHVARIPERGSLNVGPFRLPVTVRLEASTTGTLDYSAPDPLLDTVAAGADRIRSARIIQHHLIEGKRYMALHDKMKALADRARSVPKVLGDRADATLARFDAAEKRGDQAFAKMDAFVDDMERGVAATEDALNQLTNGAPLGES